MDADPSILYMNALPTPVVVVGSQLTLDYMNPAAEHALGSSVAMMRGKHLEELPGFNDQIAALCRRAVRENTPMRLLEQVLVFGKSKRRVSLHVSPVYPIGDPEQPHNRQPEQWLICLEKIEGLEHTASSKWKQEATRTAGVMAAMLAHEVKNPLSGIRGAAQLLRDEVEDEQKPMTELICSEVDRIKDLLAQVEVFAGGVPGNLTPFNIHEVLQYVLSISKTGVAAHVNFIEKYDPSLPPVFSHRDMLVQLFLNLIKNASEALSDIENPTIIISTAFKSGQHYTLQEGDKRSALPLVVSIEDNGAGIPDAMREHLFEPFISTKEGGRGLGLAIVAKIAADLGALVELDETVENGTRFCVALSMADSATEPLTGQSPATKLAS